MVERKRIELPLERDQSGTKNTHYSNIKNFNDKCTRFVHLKIQNITEGNWAFQAALVVKNPPANVGDVRDEGSVPGSGRPPGGKHSNPLQYSCLENPHGQRSLVGYSPWGHKESYTAEVT